MFNTSYIKFEYNSYLLTFILKQECIAKALGLEYNSTIDHHFYEDIDDEALKYN